MLLSFRGRIIFSLIKRYLEHKVNYPNATIKKTLILSDLGGGEVILHNNTFCSKIPKEDLSDLLLNTLNYFFLSLIPDPLGSPILQIHREVWQKTLSLSYSLFFTLHSSP